MNIRFDIQFPVTYTYLWNRPNLYLCELKAQDDRYTLQIKITTVRLPKVIVLVVGLHIKLHMSGKVFSLIVFHARSCRLVSVKFRPLAVFVSDFL